VIRLLAKLEITDRASFFLFIKQFIKFGIVGVSNTVIALGTYYLLIFLGVHYLIANGIAFVISVCNAYFWNSRFVFKVKSKSAVPFIRVFVVYTCTALLSTGLLYLMVDILLISQWIAPLINLCITIPLNFLLNKFWALREEKSK